MAVFESITGTGLDGGLQQPMRIHQCVRCAGVRPLEIVVEDVGLGDVESGGGRGGLVHAV
ncbi:hypothetical protein AB0O58_15145 [Rhodococcus sp. NPDC080181]|uniref:hypothetical protein n=1 Tax=Rhodococcus sp. NPDC080181 TaxID=3155292 RepID=UPI00344BC5A3